MIFNTSNDKLYLIIVWGVFWKRAEKSGLSVELGDDDDDDDDVDDDEARV